MREILFRGKRVDNGEWVEGYYVNSIGPDCEPNETRHYIVTYPGDWHEVYTSTVGQYTGLKDRNEKRIFEGDILDYINADGELIGYPCVVRFGEYNCSCCDGVYGWVFDGECGDIRDFAGCEECGPYQIIGNIHDNPDLLK
jgi:uncharacterized phage protein (TIGR01671 family)